MKNIIFDCDNTMGITNCDVDDGLALLYLLGQENINILGITTTYGNSNLETVYSNTKEILQDLNLCHIPLLKGCIDNKSLSSEAVDFIINKVNNNVNEICILATGSLTNLYGAYLKDNNIFNKISEIVLMGGITEELIINNKTLDELNFSCDPIATKYILSKGKNISIITGNNCIPAYFNKSEFMNKLKENNNFISRYIDKKCMHWFDRMENVFGIDGFHNWDVVAAAYLVNPSLFKDTVVDINIDLDNLSTGYIPINTSTITSSINIKNLNLPIIKDVLALSDNIYNSWLKSKIL